MHPRKGSSLGIMIDIRMSIRMISISGTKDHIRPICNQYLSNLLIVVTNHLLFG